MDMSMSTGMSSTMVATSTAMVASATPMGMHMNMGGDGSCKLSMLFNWNVIDACFLSASWRITSKAMFAGSCIGVTLLVMFLEFIRRLQRLYERSVARDFEYQQIGPDGVSLLGGEQGMIAAEVLSSALKREMLQPSSSSPVQIRRGGMNDSSNGSGMKRYGYRDAIVQQTVRALLHTTGFAVAYLVMLMAMYFNGYIIICILVGAFLGSFVFSWDQLRPLPSRGVVSLAKDSGGVSPAEFSQIHPNPGWAEHDPDEIIASVHNCIEGAVEQFKKDGHSTDSIKAIGITNQRETTVVWDVKTGEALHNAIVWTDTRTGALARELKARPGSDDLMNICGEPISSYPSATKLLWLLKNVEKVREVYEKGDLAFGTIDAWLVYKLNGGPEKNVFVSDATNASRTMFMDIRDVKYSKHLLDFFSYEFDLSKVHMPEIVKSSDEEAFGSISSGPLQGHRITGCLGDQSAALVGQKGFDPGSAKNTYGTGCFLLYNVGDKPVISTHGLLATVAYDFPGGHRAYALEGSIAVAGSGVHFLMHNLGFSFSSHKITELASTVDNNGGLVFVTAFSGLFAPYWIDDCQGTMFGITQHTQRGHIARATLEAVCFQTKAILDAMEKDSGHKLQELKVDGGMSNSALCMQTQADLVGIPIVRPKMRETTALGAAIAAGFAVGVWKDFDELKDVNRAGETTFEREMEDKDAAKLLKSWEKAVKMCKGWVDSE